MSKFNKTSKNVTKTTNLAGGEAYILPKKEKLITGVLTSLYNEGKYYGDNSKEIVALIRDMAKSDYRFVANLAVYARKKMFLRSISHVIVAELAAIVKGSTTVRQAITSVCERPDDITEILSYYIATYGKPIPNSLKKGVAAAFNNFDEYQLAKYNRKQDLTLRDALRISHPRPKDKAQEIIFGKLKEDTLETPYTWEVELSAKGNNAETWSELIESKKVGYMAMLRNLRNIVNAGPLNMKDAFAYIANENAVGRSKQIPFRFYSAYKELQAVTGATKAIEAVQDAMQISVNNLPKLPGKTLIVSDVSGSMSSKLSAKSSMSYKEVGMLMCATAANFCEDAVVSVFGSNFQTVNISSRDSILSNVKTLDRINVGYSTEMWKVFDWMISSKVKFDRVIVFSDMQAYTAGFYGRQNPQGLADQYKKEINKDLHIVSVDLAGHGTSQFDMYKKVSLLAGWNPNILEIISRIEAGASNIIKDIEGFYFK